MNLFSYKSSIKVYRVGNIPTSIDNTVKAALNKIRELGAKRIMVFGSTSAIERVIFELIESLGKDNDILVKVIDECADGTGKRFVKKLLKRNVQCAYGLLNCLAYELFTTDLVLLNATSVTDDGNVLAPRGTMAVAHIAETFQIPALLVESTCALGDQFTETIPNSKIITRNNTIMS